MSHSITDNDEHSVVLLCSSKSDYDHTGVKIMVANTGEETCPVSALLVRALSLYNLDPQLSYFERTMVSSRETNI
jgi:hypothetical protein